MWGGLTCAVTGPHKLSPQSSSPTEREWDRHQQGVVVGTGREQGRAGEGKACPRLGVSPAWCFTFSPYATLSFCFRMYSCLLQYVQKRLELPSEENKLPTLSAPCPLSHGAAPGPSSLWSPRSRHAEVTGTPARGPAHSRRRAGETDLSGVTPEDDFSLHNPHLCPVLDFAKVSLPTTPPSRFYTSPMGPAGVMNISILQMRKLRPREAKQLTQDDIVSTGRLDVVQTQVFSFPDRESSAGLSQNSRPSRQEVQARGSQAPLLPRGRAGREAGSLLPAHRAVPASAGAR